MRRICLLVVVLIALCSQAANANGYDVYAAPLAWSPDGHLLAAAVNDVWPRDDTLAQGALRLYGRNGEVVANLARGLCGTPSFSPDGKLLAAVVDGNLAIYDVATGQTWAGFKPPSDNPAVSGKVLDCFWNKWIDYDGTVRGEISLASGERFYGCSAYYLGSTGEDGEWDPYEPNTIIADETGGSVFRPLNYGGAFLTLEQNGALTKDFAYEQLTLAGDNDSGGFSGLFASGERNHELHESNAVLIENSSEIIFQRGGWGDWKIYSSHQWEEPHLEVADAQQPALDASGSLLAYVRRDWQAKQAAEYDWDVPSTVRLRNRATGEDVAVSTPEVYAELPALSPDGERIAWLEQNAVGQAQVAIRTVPGVIRHGPGIIPGSTVGTPRGASAGSAVITNGDSGGAPPPTEGEVDKVSADGARPVPTGEAVTRVVFETTKGKIVFAVHPDWAPIGAAHFLDLVRLGFYDGAPWFRVIDRKDPNNPDAPPTPFVAQCGIAADPELNKQWGEATIQDDPVVMGNTRGRIAYGKTDEPNSRSTHIYINFGDNSRLDAKGFAAFAEVVEGMDVADSLYKCEFEDQDALAAPGGMEAFKAMFPDADYILKAYIEEDQ